MKGEVDGGRDHEGKKEKKGEVGGGDEKKKEGRYPESVGPGFSFGSFYETDRRVISRTFCGTCVPRAELSLAGLCFAGSFYRCTLYHDSLYTIIRIN